MYDTQVHNMISITIRMGTNINAQYQLFIVYYYVQCNVIYV